MNPDNRQQILALLQKHIAHGESIDVAKQNVISEGFNSALVQELASSVKPVSAGTYDVANVLLAENDVAKSTRRFLFRKYVVTYFAAGFFLPLIFLVFPWYNVSCNNSFYRAYVPDRYRNSCTTLRVSGIPLPVYRYLTVIEQLPNGQNSYKVINVSQIKIGRGVFNANTLICGGVGALIGLIRYSRIKKLYPTPLA